MTPSVPDAEHALAEVLDVFKLNNVELPRRQESAAIVCVALWDKLGRPKEFRPYNVMVGPYEHTILFEKNSGFICDPMASWFGFKQFRFTGLKPQYRAARQMQGLEMNAMRIEGIDFWEERNATE